MADKELDRALEALTYGVYVVTAGDGVDGAAVLTPWLSQVSRKPPQLAFSLPNNSSARGLLAEGAAFVVSVLRAGDRTIAERFVEASGGEADEVAMAETEGGVRYVAEALAVIEGAVLGVTETGKDFVLVVGGSLRVVARRDGQPLTLRQSGISGYF